MSPDAPGGGVRTGVLLLADSQDWETDALAALRGSRDHVVARRCLDVADLMAVAVTGEAPVALVAGDAGGFDAACVAHLAGHGVAVVAVVPTGAPVGAWTPPHGTGEVVGPELADLGDVLSRVVGRAGAGPATPTDGAAAVTGRDVVGGVPAPDDQSDQSDQPDQPDQPDRRRGRVLAVWGPVGAPGRTTVALALAGELAARGRSTVLADLDAWGGTVAQHLGILTEVSGLLAAARATTSGTLTTARLEELCVTAGRRLRVLTGLPHPDRWSEVGPGAVERLVAPARAAGDVVLDVGFALDPATLGGWGGTPVREHLATEAVAVADHVLLVGAADPVGLARLVRAAEQLREVRPEGPDLVLVNRVRNTLGWSSAEVADLVGRAVPEARVVTLPEDRAGVDRAMAEGSLLVETGPGPLRATVRDLVDDVVLPLLGHATVPADDGGQASSAAPVAARNGVGSRLRARRARR